MGNKAVKVVALRPFYDGSGGPKRSAGEEFETSPDRANLLAERRFVKCVDVPEEVETLELDDLTVAQLREFAEENGIALTATKKADILAEIEAAQGE